MKRIEYLDRARAIGMFLVYYGHVVEKLFREAGVETALTHWKFVYSFHIPFFFFLLLFPLWVLLDYKRFGTYVVN